MIELNAAQARMREDFLKAHIVTRKTSPDTSEFCFVCDRYGDNREDGSMFSTVIPCHKKTDGHGRSLVMDEIYGIWVCPQCVAQIGK